MDQITTYSTAFIEWAKVFVPKLAGALIFFFIGLYLINWITALLGKAFKKQQLEVSLQTFLGSMISVSLKILLLVSVAGMLGIQTTSFVAIIGALGLAVGLALQGSLSNFAGGVLILVFKPFKVGDLIESQGQLGYVKEIQIFNTILLTLENKTVILANGATSNNTIINYSQHGNLRVDITMAVGGENDINKVREVVNEVFKNNPLVLATPAPTVGILKTDKDAVHLAIRPHTHPDTYWDVFFGIQEQVKKAFEANKIVGPEEHLFITNKG